MTITYLVNCALDAAFTRIPVPTSMHMQCTWLKNPTHPRSCAASPSGGSSSRHHAHALKALCGPRTRPGRHVTWVAHIRAPAPRAPGNPDDGASWRVRMPAKRAPARPRGPAKARRSYRTFSGARRTPPRSSPSGQATSPEGGQQARIGSNEPPPTSVVPPASMGGKVPEEPHLEPQARSNASDS